MGLYAVPPATLAAKKPFRLRSTVTAMLSVMRASSNAPLAKMFSVNGVVLPPVPFVGKKIVKVVAAPAGLVVNGPAQNISAFVRRAVMTFVMPVRQHVRVVACVNVAAISAWTT
jgi:hypothetical protein